MTAAKISILAAVLMLGPLILMRQKPEAKATQRILEDVRAAEARLQLAGAFSFSIRLPAVLVNCPDKLPLRLAHALICFVGVATLLPHHGVCFNRADVFFERFPNEQGHAVGVDCLKVCRELLHFWQSAQLGWGLKEKAVN